MSEMKELSTAALATLTDGRVMSCGFGPAHGAAEWIMGHPIWTHEFADREMVGRIKSAILAQFPDMPTGGAGDWMAVEKSAIERYGPSVMAAKGSETRKTSPIASLNKNLDASPTRPM